MSLHFLIEVNGKAIGAVMIQRRHPLVDGEPSEYGVVAECPIGEVLQATVMHHYDDGALVLIRKALVAITEHA